MNTLTIKLKQHTPLIHFQHDQDGATLRASEVKPKLDKYIIKTVFHDSFDECKQFLVGYDLKKEKDLKAKWSGGYRALDYKMRIESPKRVMELSRSNGYKMNPKTKEFILDRRGQKIPKYEAIPLFFGNMNDKAPKKMVIADEEITIEFFSLHNTLLDKINNHLNDFFFFNNFGTRQSKGFGSFYPENTKLPDVMANGAYYSFGINTKRQKGDWKDYQVLFQYIDIFYKTLRSGINQNGCYFKSMMYHYAKSKGQYWDKRAIRTHFELFTATVEKDGKKIKEEVLDNFSEKMKSDLGEKQNIREDADKGKDMSAGSSVRLYRDMLGFSTTQEWMKYGATINKTIDDVERFKSPLLIKPLFDEGTGKYVVYIIPQVITDGIQGKVATISVEYKEKNNRDLNIRNRRLQRVQASGQLSTPSNFSISDYLQYVFEGDGNIIVKEQIKKMPSGFIRDYLNDIYGVC